MSEANTRMNADFDWKWSKEDVNKYLDDSYREFIPEDRMTARATIGGFVELESTYPAIGRLETALDIGTAGVIRGSALFAPLMATKEHGATILMGDIGREKVDTTKQAAYACSLGRLGIWQVHQDHMTECDPRWEGAFQRAGELSKAIEYNVHDLSENTYQITNADHMAESATEDKEEYREIVYKLGRSVVRHGGILRMGYMEGSTGYKIGDKQYPAYPVGQSEVEQYVTESGLHVMQNTFTAASGNARGAKDPHHYSGMGVIIAQRR